MSTSRVVHVSGRGLPLAGDDIDTDRIMPARHLRAITFDGLERHLFEDDRAHAARDGHVHPMDDPRFTGAAVLVVNRNFGCGSSREHAPQAIVRSGIRAIIGESFSEIFFGNAVMLGLPAITAASEDVAALQQAVEQDPATVVHLDLAAMRASAGTLDIPVRLPETARDALMTGRWDGLGLLLENFDEVRRQAATLPYLRDFA
ncbi:MAG TPA: 3-isopropylmalate dehydratase small subunit [Vicinamibacterales bacterium]|jgi:3-isopropylmalate/(R)-2-methylmalate dehydratase small subunit|nr:3-isopropylmalate dehydratase small subunit [Vicinamibacterales bacterium]